ncbi:MAG: NAD(+)/NADH kinase [bacterium]
MKFGILANTEKQGVGEVVEKLVSRFREENVDFVVQKELISQIAKAARKGLTKRNSIDKNRLAAECDILIALGGDGTILEVARSTAQVGTPILGVNFGKLGFLAEVSTEELQDCITEILKQDYLLIDRMMIEVSTRYKKKSYLALNDIVVDKFATSRVLDFETYVDDEYLATFSADGMIVSTPTGSTAYALAIGGPILTPTNKSLIISPLSPHSLTARPVIVPDDSIVTIKVQHAPNKVHITADGQEELLISAPAEVSIRKSKWSAKLVKRKNTSYYEVLRKKLQWGRDIRYQSES